MADQINPNQLAAPAEGFGQTVSFAFDPKGNVPQQQAVTSRGPSVGGSAGPAPRMSQTQVDVSSKVDPTATLLMKAGADILGAKVDESRNAAYVDGMMQVMNGKALEEIKKEQPWYSRLWGDTPVVEGARAYSAQAKVQSVIAEQIAALPTIRNLSPAEASKHFAKVVKSSASGDPGSDLLVVKGLMDNMPQLMKAQAKEYYGYQQVIAGKAEDESFRAGGTRLQAMGAALARGTITNEDMQAAATGLIQDILPVPGRNEESYLKNATANIQLWATQGNLHAVNALKATGFIEKAGLTEQQQTAIERAIAGAELKASNKFYQTNGTAIAQLRADFQQAGHGTTAVKDLVKQAKELDTQFQNETGSTSSIFGTKGLTDLTVSGIMNVRQEAEKAQLAGMVSKDKEQAAAVLQATITEAVHSGDVKRLFGIPGGPKDDEINYAFEKEAKSGDVAANIIRAYDKGTYVNQNIKAELTAGLRGNLKTITNAGQQSVDQYNALKAKSPATAEAYFGDMAPKIEVFNRMSIKGDEGSTQAAWEVAFGDQSRFPVRHIPEKERAKVLKQITSDNSYFMPEAFGGMPDIRPEAAADLAQRAESRINDWNRTSIGPQEATKKGINALMASGTVDVVGGFVLDMPDTGRRMKDIMAPMGGVAIPAGAEHEVFKRFVHEWVKVPVSGSISIMPQQSIDGKERFAVFSNEAERPFLFDGDELAHFASTWEQKRRKKAEPFGNPMAAPKDSTTGWGPTNVLSNPKAFSSHN